MRTRSIVFALLVVVWLSIGAIAANQRGYFSWPVAKCTKASTIVVTILAGPLNYLGVNPVVYCTFPQRASSKYSAAVGSRSESHAAPQAPLRRWP